MNPGSWLAILIPMHELSCLRLRRTLPHFACIPCPGLRIHKPHPVSFCVRGIWPKGAHSLSHFACPLLPPRPLEVCFILRESAQAAPRHRFLSHFAYRS